MSDAPAKPAVRHLVEITDSYSHGDLFTNDLRANFYVKVGMVLAKANVEPPLVLEFTEAQTKGQSRPRRYFQFDTDADAVNFLMFWD